MDAPSNNLKSLGELSNLVSKSITQAIRFSTNQNFRESCMASLDVKNSFDVEKALNTKIDEWKLVKGNSSVESQSYEEDQESTGQKRKSENQLPPREFINDLDDWQ